MAAFIDVEHALDPIYARKLGVDVDNLLVSQPDYAEQALEITNALVASGSIDVLVVDSVAALVPKAELDGEMGDSHMGVQARLMSQAMRKLTGNVSKSNTCLMFINQIREKIGVMFGNPETTTGGRALKFYSSVRADIRRIAAIKEGESGGWQSNQSEDREEQGRAAIPRSRIRHYLWRGNLARRRFDRSGRRRRTWWRRAAPGTATRASASGRAGKTPASSQGQFRPPPAIGRRTSQGARSDAR